MEIRKSGKNHYPWRKIKARLEPPKIREIVKFGMLGNPGHTSDSGGLGDSGNRKIGENLYMLQKRETLAGRTRGESTN